jgi:hypothetical protein
VTVYFPTWTRSNRTRRYHCSCVKETPVASLVRVTVAPDEAAVGILDDSRYARVVPCPLQRRRTNVKRKNARIEFLMLSSVVEGLSYEISDGL